VALVAPPVSKVNRARAGRGGVAQDHHALPLTFEAAGEGIGAGQGEIARAILGDRAGAGNNACSASGFAELL
jgi:hypothetical protein